MAAGTLVVKISANITDFSRNLDAAEKRLMKAGERLERLGGDLSLKVTAPLIALSAAFAKSAAEDAASVEKMGRSFGAATGQMEKFIQTLMKSVPATDDQLRTLATSTNTLLSSMGLAPQKAAAMSQTVLKLAGDLAAYNHVSLEMATDAVTKALAGRTRGLMELNVAVTDADVKAKAYQLGLAKVGGELSSTAKAQATLAAIIERSAAQQGEAARTYGDNENALARLKQAADGVADSFGAVVLPAFVRVADAAAAMAKKLADLDPSTKTAIVATLGLAAAMGPLVYLGGNLVKMFTLARAAIMALASAQALSGILSLAMGVRSVADAIAVAQLAAGGLASALLVPAAVLAPIAAVAYLWYKSGESAREAAKKVDEFTASLALMNKEQVKAATISLQSQFDDLTTQLTAAQAKLNKIKAPPLQMGFGAGKGADPAQAAAAAEANALRDQIRDLNAARTGIAQQMVAAGQRFNALSAPGTKPPPGGGGSGSGANPFADLEEYAGRLGRVYQLTNAKGQPLAGLNAQITQTIDALTAALARQKNQWSETAVKIREALESLKKYGEATLLPGLTGKLPALTYSQAIASMGNAGAGAPGLNTTMRNITAADVMGPAGSHVTASSIGVPLQKQVTLQERMVSALATLPSQFASTLGQYLGPVIARMGGGTGGAIGASLGGAVGNAVGGAIAGSMIGATTGKIAGAVIGSAIPVVGTIIGSMAGSFLGGTIGKLFGGGGKSAAEKAAEQLQKLAIAAQKVNEAISGLPQGIKIAAYRYNATSPDGMNGQGRIPGLVAEASDPYTLSDLLKGKPRPTSSAAPIIIQGDVHFNGVQDVPSMHRSLSAYIESQGGRGGVMTLQPAGG